jgi:hypothetical protein
MTFAFKPIGATLTISASGTTSTAANGIIGFTSDDVSAPGKDRVVRCFNGMTSGILFLKFGTSAVGAATTADLPMQFGSTETFTLPPETTHVRVITSTGSASFYITPGVGV